MSKITFRKYLILFFIALLTSLFLYHSSLNYYFFQDDFFEMSIANADNFSEFFKFFEFRGGIIDYRPISQRFYFFAISKVFGLNPLAFRFINYFLFLISSYLIVKVITKLSGNFKIAFLTSILWLVSAIHFMTLTWISAGYNIIGTFFWLFTSFIFLKYLATKEVIYYFFSITFFLLTIGSYEFSITWPVIFSFYCLFILKKPFSKIIKIFFPFILISAVYLVFRSIYIKIPQIPEYNVVLNFESIKALFWYFLWSLNIPEEFKKQIIGNLLVFNPKFLAEFWPLITKTFLGAFLTILIAVILPIIRSLRRGTVIRCQMIIFGIFWFMAAISPVLVLPNHTFSMYLTLSSIGIYLVLSYLLVNYGVVQLALPLILIWVATSQTTLSFYKVNSWMIEAQRTARQANVNLKNAFPRLPHHSSVYYPLASHWERQALAQNHSIQSFYNDPTLSIYYNKEQLKDDYLNSRLKGPVYIYVPK